MAIIASLLIKYLKIKIDIYILFMYIISLILSRINSRFICIAYGGSILSIIFLLINNIDNSIYILYLIAIFHLIEGLLIYIDSYRNRNPIYLEKKGEIRAGYYFDLIWMLPIITNIDGYFVFLPLVLGYRNLISSGKVKKRTNKYAISSILYGCSNILFIYFVHTNKILLFVLSIYSIIAHELIIKLNTKNYTDNRYLCSKIGVTVLDVINENSLLHPLDIIIEINNHKVDDINDIKRIISKDGKYYHIKYIDANSKIRKISINSYKLNIVPLINNPPIITNYIEEYRV